VELVGNRRCNGSSFTNSVKPSEALQISVFKSPKHFWSLDQPKPIKQTKNALKTQISIVSAYTLAKKKNKSFNLFKKSVNLKEMFMMFLIQIMHIYFFRGGST